MKQRYERIPFGQRTKEQQEAISRYCKTAHPTNVPKDLDTAVPCCYPEGSPLPSAPSHSPQTGADGLFFRGCRCQCKRC